MRGACGCGGGVGHGREGGEEDRKGRSGRWVRGTGGLGDVGYFIPVEIAMDGRIRGTGCRCRFSGGRASGDMRFIPSSE